jgi:hypothetical protein
MLEVLSFILIFIIAFAVYKGINFISRFEIGKAVLLTYLGIRITGDLLDLLLKVLK